MIMKMKKWFILRNSKRIIRQGINLKKNIKKKTKHQNKKKKCVHETVAIYVIKNDKN